MAYLDLSSKKSLLDEINFFTPKSVNKRSDRHSSTVSNENYDFVYFFIIFLCISSFSALFFRSIFLQVLNYEDLSNKASDNFVFQINTLSERGYIYDKNGVVLARSEPKFTIEYNLDLCMRKKDIATCTEDLKKITKIYSNLKEPFLSNNSTQIIALGLNKEQILPIEANKDLFPGLIIEYTPTRLYDYPYETAHTLGYVGLDDSTLNRRLIGKSGIEAYYDDTLRGVDGSKLINTDATGKVLSEINSINSLPGKNLTLFLDIELQKLAYDSLKEKIDEKKEAKAGVVVAQDPTNGGILAIVSYPSFDTNKMMQGISYDEYNKLQENNFPFFNRAIGASYPPGSVFKMVTLSAALMESIIDKDFAINDEGFLSINGYTFRNWKLDGHGVVGVLKALQVSNDTFFYTIGGGYGNQKGLGISKLYTWALKFGFSKKTGIDLPGEISGFFPDGKSKDWYLGDDYISAIGQGDILVTPLQINNMVTYFANGGRIYKPRIVKSIENNNTEEVLYQENIVSDNHYDLIREGMFLAANPGGTAYPFFTFQTPSLKAAGKTGTAEYLGTDGKMHTHAWFSVFAPYKKSAQDQENVTEKDNPIVITVFLEDGASGSDDAAPIARKLIDFWYQKD